MGIRECEVADRGAIDSAVIECMQLRKFAGNRGGGDASCDGGGGVADRAGEGGDAGCEGSK